MALNVYSATFFEEHDLDGQGGAVGPPAGFLWVLRGADVVCGNSLGLVTLQGAVGSVWANDFAGSPVGFSYGSYRGRYVLYPGTVLFFTTTAAMDVAAWGYQLTLP